MNKETTRDDLDAIPVLGCLPRDGKGGCGRAGHALLVPGEQVADGEIRDDAGSEVKWAVEVIGMLGKCNGGREEMTCH